MKVDSFYLNITSEDPARLHAFYRDVVGLQPRPEQGEHSLDIGGGSLLGIDGHPSTRGAAKEPTRHLINFFVADVAAEQDRLEGQGVHFIRKQGREFWGGVISTFVDPDGNYAQIVEYHPETAAAE